MELNDKNKLIKFSFEHELDICPTIILWANGIVSLEHVEEVCKVYNTSLEELCKEANLTREGVISC